MSYGGVVDLLPPGHRWVQWKVPEAEAPAEGEIHEADRSPESYREVLEVALSGRRWK